jgi:hypothetical protein
MHTGEYFRYVFSEGATSQSVAVGIFLVLGLLIKKTCRVYSFKILLGLR